MNQRTHTDALRDASADLADELEQLADALDAGDATADDVRDVHVEIATTMVDLEDAASTADVLDDQSSRARAIDEARKAIYHLSHDNGGSALTSLVAAAENAEEAYSSE